MEARKLAELLVDQYHISDLEWRDCLVDQFVEILEATQEPPKPQFKPFLIVSNSGVEN
jgi:hypothetical protein